jgi:cytochrome P450
VTSLSLVQNEEFLKSNKMLVLSVVVIIALGLAWTTWIELRKRFLGYPPGPTPLPLIGNLLQFNIHAPLETLSKWADKYGPIIQFWAGPESVVVLSSPEAVHEALVVQAQKFNDRKKPNIPELNGWQGLISASGKIWRDNRKHFTFNLMRNVHSQGGLIQEEAKISMARMLEVGESGKVPFDPRPLTKRLAFAVICRLFMGDNLRNTTGDELLQLFDYILSTSSPVSSLVMRFKILRSVPYISRPFHALFKTAKRVESICQNIIDEHLQGFDGKNPRDFLDQLLLIQKEEGFDSIRIVKLIGDSLIAGSDTSSTTIEWMLVYLCLYPEIQEKVHFELDQVIGKERTPELDDLPKLPYLSAVIMEIMRIRPVAFVGVPHQCSEQTKIGNITVSEGSTVLINIYKLANDSKLWKNPSQFRPERFLEEEKHLDLKGSETRNIIEDFKFIPFGVGRRACAGFQLAKLEVYVVAMQLFHKFKFEFPEGSKPDTTPRLGIVLRPQSYKVLAKPRI